MRKKLRNSMNIENDFVIGTIARFNQQKNHIFLIDIFAEIVKLKPSSKLILIGDGELKDVIDKKIEKNDLGKYVIFMGIKQNINELLNMMDAFVLPSLYEGLGIVYIEAQANGLPCYASAHVVPEAAKVTNLIQYIELNNNPKEWALSILEGKRRDDINDILDIRNQGFDMTYEVHRLEQIYLK